ncbi:ABC-three component system middle component 6 [Lactococcus garvieae]|uniref:ABC-three component system middle component 6 n=1 Tax=Lactococcus garvieae TaxID=1363 RepID=UPI0022E19780|nr:ABC-three component system middle component 6 [Lactococcus garvieae]
MLLLDKNTLPENTVYYLSGIISGLLRKKDGIDSSELYYMLMKTAKEKINYDFYMLALDFLFLVDKLKLDDSGGLHYVY